MKKRSRARASHDPLTPSQMRQLLVAAQREGGGARASARVLADALLESSSEDLREAGELLAVQLRAKRGQPRATFPGREVDWVLHTHGASSCRGKKFAKLEAFKRTATTTEQFLFFVSPAETYYTSRVHERTSSTDYVVASLAKHPSLDMPEILLLPARVKLTRPYGPIKEWGAVNYDEIHSDRGPRLDPFSFMKRLGYCVFY